MGGDAKDPPQPMVVPVMPGKDFDNVEVPQVSIPISPPEFSEEVPDSASQKIAAPNDDDPFFDLLDDVDSGEEDDENPFNMGWGSSTYPAKASSSEQKSFEVGDDIEAPSDEAESEEEEDWDQLGADWAEGLAEVLDSPSGEEGNDSQIEEVTAPPTPSVPVRDQYEQQMYPPPADLGTPRHPPAPASPAPSTPQEKPAPSTAAPAKSDRKGAWEAIDGMFPSLERLLRRA